VVLALLVVVVLAFLVVILALLVVILAFLVVVLALLVVVLALLVVVLLVRDAVALEAGADLVEDFAEGKTTVPGGLEPLGLAEPFGDRLLQLRAAAQQRLHRDEGAL